MKNKNLTGVYVLLGIVLIALGVWVGFYLGSQKTTPGSAVNLQENSTATTTALATTKTVETPDNSKIFSYDGYGVTAPQNWNINVYYSEKKVNEISLQDYDYSQQVTLNVNNLNSPCSQYSGSPFYCKDINEGPFSSVFASTALNDITNVVDFMASKGITYNGAVPDNQTTDKYNLNVYNNGTNWTMSTLFGYGINDEAALEYPVDKGAVFFQKSDGSTLKILVDNCTSMSPYYSFDSAPTGMSADNVLSMDGNQYYKYISSDPSSQTHIEYIASGLPNGRCVVADAMLGVGQSTQNQILQFSNEIETMLQNLSVSR